MGAPCDAPEEEYGAREGGGGSGHKGGRQNLFGGAGARPRQGG